MNPRARERRFRRIKEFGCLACRKLGHFRPAEVHHQNFNAHAGGKRLGDEFTVGLCDYHHRGAMLTLGTDRMPLSRGEQRVLLGPSLALEPNAFRETFGSDEKLLAYQNRLIAQAERVARAGSSS